jgi:transposase
MRRAIQIQLDEAMRRKLERVVSRRPSASDRLVERVQIVLRATAGAKNVDIASRLDISRQKAGRWRDRFAAGGLAGIEKDAPRSGRLPLISKRKRASIVRKTTTETPAHATHWSRASMTAATGVSASTIGRIWRSYGLKPHLSTTFKPSNDRRFAEKVGVTGFV